MVDSEDRYSTEKASSVQSSILYDCDAEALSVEVLLDTPPGSPKNCPEARGGSVRVQITLSRPVNFFMVKPRLCPRQDQSIPVQSRRPLGFGQVFSDQPAASRLEHCELVCVNSTWNLGFPLSLKIVSQREAGLSGPYRPDYWCYVCRQYVRNPPILGLCRGSDVKSKVVDIKAMRFPLLEARSWQEAKSNLVTVALGKDDRIAWSWTLGPPAGTGLKLYQCRGRGVKFVTLTGLSLARHVALPDHGVGLDGQLCSCLIVGWPVGLSSPTLGVGRPSVMFLFDCWPVGRPMLRTVAWVELLGCLGRTVRLLVRIAVRLHWMKTLKWREFEAKPKPEAKEWRQIQRTGQWYGLDRWEETKLRWERTSSVVGETKIEKMVGLIRNEHGQDRIRAMSVLWQSKRKRMT
ncbi:hypothetical protein YC2023_108411 [Brassica napus]